MRTLSAVLSAAVLGIGLLAASSAASDVWAQAQTLKQSNSDDDDAPSTNTAPAAEQDTPAGEQEAPAAEQEAPPSGRSGAAPNRLQSDSTGNTGDNRMRMRTRR